MFIFEIEVERTDWMVWSLRPVSFGSFCTAAGDTVGFVMGLYGGHRDHLLKPRAGGATLYLGRRRRLSR